MRVVLCPLPDGVVEPVLMSWAQRCDRSSRWAFGVLGPNIASVILIVLFIIAVVFLVIFVAIGLLGDDVLHLVRVTLQSFRGLGGTLRRFSDLGDEVGHDFSLLVELLLHARDGAGQRVLAWMLTH